MTKEQAKTKFMNLWKYHALVPILNDCIENIEYDSSIDNFDVMKITWKSHEEIAELFAKEIADE